MEQDNQATVIMAQAGYSQKLRYFNRTQKINIESIKEILERDKVNIRYINTNLQVADISMKSVTPEKWENAMQIMNMITGNPRSENSAWPKNIMFDIPQAPAAANKKQRERLRKQQEQLDAKKPPKGPEAVTEIVDDIFHHFNTEGLDKEVIDLLLKLSHSKSLE